jgi:hypothetical protein
MIMWQTDDFDFTPNQGFYRLILASFHPPGMRG